MAGVPNSSHSLLAVPTPFFSKAVHRRRNRCREWGSAHMIPAPGIQNSTLRAARRRYTAGNMLRTAWWKHAGDGMVNVHRRRCAHDSCTTEPFFNVEGSQAGVYSRQQAEDGKVNVRSRRCSYDFCTRQQHFNVEGSKAPVYCWRHAEDGMVNVLSRRCAHNSCTVKPCFNVEGSEAGVYCRQHAVRRHGGRLQQALRT